MLLEQHRKPLDPFETFCLDRSLRFHFTQIAYDYHKYRGKAGVSVAQFEKRTDKAFYHKLAKRDDVGQYLLANISHDPRVWSDSLPSKECEAQYFRWLKTKESLTYTFRDNIDQLEGDFKSHFVVTNGEYPSALKKMVRQEITKETIVILNRLLNFLGHWKANIKDPILWPEIHTNLVKYSVFVDVDLYKYKDVLQQQIVAQLDTV